MDVKHFIKKYGTYILSGLTVLGVPTSVALAVKADRKVREDIQEREARGDSLDDRDRRRIVLRNWIKPGAAILITEAAAIGAAVTGHVERKAILGEYALLGDIYKKYRAAADEVFGDDADDRIRCQIAEAKAKDISRTIETPPWWERSKLFDGMFDADESITVLDPFSSLLGCNDRYIQTTKADLVGTLVAMQDKYRATGTATFADFYDFIGVVVLPDSENHGWDKSFSNIEEIFFTPYPYEVDGGMSIYLVECGIEPAWLYYPPARKMQAM